VVTPSVEQMADIVEMSEANMYRTIWDSAPPDYAVQYGVSWQQVGGATALFLKALPTIALEFALRHSHRLSHLILLDTAPVFDYSEEIMENALRMGATEDMIEALREDWSTDEEMRRRFPVIWPLYFKSFDPDIARRLVENCVINASGGAREGELSAYNVVPRLGEIHIPTLILVGREDFICPPAQAQIMHDGIANSELVCSSTADICPTLRKLKHSSIPCETGSNERLECALCLPSGVKAPSCDPHQARLSPHKRITIYGDSPMDRGFRRVTNIKRSPGQEARPTSPTTPLTMLLSSPLALAALVILTPAGIAVPSLLGTEILGHHVRFPSLIGHSDALQDHLA